MQLPILRTLALVAVGNAALGGRNVSGFWPDDPIFQYTASLDFMAPREQGPLAHVACGPIVWFDKLKKRGCRGLRLHAAPMQQNRKLGHIDERKLVGLVGGGPRWLVEPVYPERSELWEGFDRIGDQKAPDGKIWLSAYVLIGEADSADRVDTDIRAASEDLRRALVSAEEVAQDLPGAQFADTFVAARRALEGQDLPSPLPLLKFAQLTPEATRLLKATGRAWVFGGPGSWNAIVPTGAVQPRYEQASQVLFASLQRAVLVIGNSTYRG
ncbi:MAG: hypothetical protein H7124_15035 [Phycisphaerales bacterium]|nr:hypothetical protein [Hyphomonadaceae bacterium]